FLQSPHVDTHLLVDGLNLFWKSRHLTLIGSLCRGRHLRQPSLLQVPDGQVGGLPYQVHPLD
ncbi:hypothetical protein NL386_38385, partial [Klebsiella pneumoniae]|nr:hypothetical protein [Klebsiella pneumoniae]